MVSTRSSALIKSELIRYISSLGLTVNTVTKARGNKGFFKEGRIDVSKNLDDDSALKTLVHEFAHYINYKLDNKLKDFEILFGQDSKELRDELINITMWVDESALCSKLNREREKLKSEIKNLTNSIKIVYPKFSLSENFKEFDRYSRFSDLKYLEKYDRVKVQSMFSHKIYSISTVKTDFPDIPEPFIDYLKLKSKQRKRSKISRRIGKLNKYYNEPCELFARFVEGIFIDIDKVKSVAPKTFDMFSKKYNQNYYPNMRELFAILRILI